VGLVFILTATCRVGRSTPGGSTTSSTEREGADSTTFDWKFASVLCKLAERKEESLIQPWLGYRAPSVPAAVRPNRRHARLVGEMRGGLELESLDE
jgi:hypothetical protein